MHIERMHFGRASKTGALRWLPIIVLVCGVWCGAGQSFAIGPDLSAAGLRAKFTELGKQLHNNPFRRALYLDSAESSQDLQGEIYAVVDHPFNAVSAALNNPAHWCDVLILHVNVKYCHASSNQANPVLTVNLGRKYDQPLAETYRAEFSYRGVITTADYFAVVRRH